MNPIQLQMLKRFSQFARNIEFFGTASGGYQGLAAKVAKRHIDELAKAVMVVEVKTGWKLTQKGRDFIDAPGEVLRPDRHVNASQPAMEKLPHEMRSHRPGADQHAQFKSFGTLC